MKKQIAKLPMLTLCAAVVLAVTASARAQAPTNAPAAALQAPPPVAAEPTPPPAAVMPAPPAAPAPAPPAKKRSAPPQFHGALTAVDTNAMTLTVEKRTFEMTSETIVIKDGKPAILADGVVGDEVHGEYKKATGGKLDAVTVHFGGAADDKKKKKKESADK
jgi:hypothetical protein